MDRRSFFGAGFFVAINLFACQANAFSTNLINFPIADILKHREGLYTVQANGFARNVNKGFSWGQTATIGVCDHAELGWSQDFMGHSVYDAKVQLVDDQEKFGTLSFGISAWDVDAHTNDVFLSYRKDVGNFRCHATAYRSDKINGIFGVDFAGPCGWGCAVEHQTGSDSQTWVGFTSPQIAKGLTATLTSRLPWDGGSGSQYQVILNYGFRF